MTAPLALRVNGQHVQVDDVAGNATLLDVLRERLGLLDVKKSCEAGVCGACSVYINDRLMYSCLLFAHQVPPRDVVTPAWPGAPPLLKAAQRALIEEGAVQCGFCTPGVLLAIHNLLRRTAKPTREEVYRALDGNLCRCTGYQSMIRAAMRLAADPDSTSGPGHDDSIRHPESGATGLAGLRMLLPDQEAKVCGAFTYAGDLTAPDMAWGATVRSPHPHALIKHIDKGSAARMPGVLAVLTAEDVRGRRLFGIEIADQPVLSTGEVRYVGEPVAVVVATSLRNARVAAARVPVDYQILPAVLDADLSAPQGSGTARAGPGCFRHIAIRQGEGREDVPVVVRGYYEVGMQDPAFLGPESGLAIPTAEGGVELHVATQSLHADREQIAASLALAPEKVRVRLAGVAGAFGGREDISMQIHACMAALAVGRPVKMTYSLSESIASHVHRHPAKLWYEHGAAADGKIHYVKARILLDGGAYASTSGSVCLNAARFAVGPYAVPAVRVDSIAAITNNPPAGAMRGFGAVQTCFAYESQMDKLAAAVEVDPLQIRLRNVMPAPWGQLPTGERVNTVPVNDLLRSVAMEASSARNDEVRQAPARARRERGVGYAIGLKNVGTSRATGGIATAAVELRIADGRVQAAVSCSAVDLGQGLSNIEAIIVRRELGVGPVVIRTPSTDLGYAPSTSASRQTWLIGGAVRAACEAIRARVLEIARVRSGLCQGDLRLAGEQILAPDGTVIADLTDIVAGEKVISETSTYKRTPDSLGVLAVAYAAHKAVVDVDLDLGAVELQHVEVWHDAGYMLDEAGVRGQLEGATAQGIGLAISEELNVIDGRIVNSALDTYLVPTARDVGPIHVSIAESRQEDAPYGVRGVGEAGIISSGPAVIAAIRAATHLPLSRMPIRPEDILELPRPDLDRDSRCSTR